MEFVVAAFGCNFWQHFVYESMAQASLERGEKISIVTSNGGTYVKHGKNEKSLPSKIETNAPNTSIIVSRPLRWHH